jgi:pimeloyl-ACP methyl ester carboxylesterase
VVRFVAVTIGVYIAACVFVALAYRPFLFPRPSRAPITPAGSKVVEGGTAKALRFGPDDATTTIVFFHGNGELADDGEWLARQFVAQGFAVYLAEYPGYGMSAGAGGPSEKRIYEDAEAIVRATNATNAQIVLMGMSLGTGVATEMAARGHGRALVLLAPYTSIPAVAQSHVRHFPMGLLMRDRFDTLSKAPSISMPVFVAHGDKDEVIPFEMGETVAHTFPKGRFNAVSGATHMTLFQYDDHLMSKIVDFIITTTPL